MIELADVVVELGGARVLDGVGFGVGRGEWVALIGPNGAGKTTALRAVTGLVGYDGSIRVGGGEARELGRRRLARACALVPQLPERPPELTVAEYVLLGRTPHLGYLAAEGAGDRAAAARALARLELTPFAHRLLTSLSGGELQRAVLARALAQEADVLLLDEPTSALDLGRQQQALELVHELRDDGLTILSTMHDLTLAGQYADRLVLLDRGVVVADGAPGDVLSAEAVAAHYGAAVRVVEEEGRVYVLPLPAMVAAARSRRP
ncbi:MAG TPA: ABC transporter ATP-binding protein [Gaiellaceae bacterium]|nr:ABC transporter ATP-binding protein [Gaiellaceae bacterium]